MIKNLSGSGGSWSLAIKRPLVTYTIQGFFRLTVGGGRIKCLRKRNRFITLAASLPSSSAARFGGISALA
jgi:hypothetical protein